MWIPSEQQAITQIAKRLCELVGLEPNEIHIKAGHAASSGIINLGPFTFVVQWKSSGFAAQVASAIEQVRRYADDVEKTAILLVAVPFMGDTGRERCAKARIGWLDLSGNAQIIAPGLRILVEGKPNQFKRPGRPSSVFAPKSSRIVRWLLMHPDEPMAQRELARATATDEGYTSKIVARLKQDGLIVQNSDGAIKARDPDLLLDAWREAYKFSKHHIIRGHVAARAGDVLLHQLADKLKQASVPYAATGLAAAWLLDRFAGFRTTTLYLTEEPSSSLLGSLSFREDSRGANVWLVVANDEGVFHGATEIDDIQCVHPVQCYLDLGAHPERAEEASQQLRMTMPTLLHQTCN